MLCFVCLCDAGLNAWACRYNTRQRKNPLITCAPSLATARKPQPRPHTQPTSHRQNERKDKDKTLATMPFQNLRRPPSIFPPFAADLLSLRHPSLPPSTSPQPSTMLPPSCDHHSNPPDDDNSEP